MYPRVLWTLRLVGTMLAAALLLPGTTQGVTLAAALNPSTIFIPLVRAPAYMLPLPEDATLLRVSPDGGVSECGAEQSCNSIQAALDAALAAPELNHVIQLAGGVYMGQGDAVAKVHLGPDKHASSGRLIIVGGYTESNWTTPSLPRTQTTLDGQGARRGVLVRSVPGIRVELHNLTIQNALGDQPARPSGEYVGGGLLCKSDNPNEPTFVDLTLSNILFRHNSVRGVGNESAGGGGASLYFRCNGTLRDVTFEDNQALGGEATDETRGGQALGGGLQVTSGLEPQHRSTLTVQGVTFRNNRAVAGSGGQGRSINGWRADGLGGGASIQAATATLRDVSASGNEALGGQGAKFGGYGSGGAIFFEHATVTLTDGQFMNNLTRGGDSTGAAGTANGGAIMATNGALLLDRLWLLGNRAVGGDSSSDAGDANGGAISLDTGRADFDPMQMSGSNLVIARNRAEAGQGAQNYGGGGGISINSATVLLDHATIVANTVVPAASMMAPGVLAQPWRPFHPFSTLTLSNSIIAGHGTAADPDAVVAHGEGAHVTLYNTLFHDNASNAGTSFAGGTLANEQPRPEADPRFVAPTRDDFHLQPGSPAIDAAPDSALPFDIDGQQRVVPDIGADEQ